MSVSLNFLTRKNKIELIVRIIITEYQDQLSFWGQPFHCLLGISILSEQ